MKFGLILRVSTAESDQADELGVSRWPNDPRSFDPRLQREHYLFENVELLGERPHYYEKFIPTNTLILLRMAILAFGDWNGLLTNRVFPYKKFGPFAVGLFDQRWSLSHNCFQGGFRSFRARKPLNVLPARALFIPNVEFTVGVRAHVYFVYGLASVYSITRPPPACAHFIVLES